MKTYDSVQELGEDVGVVLGPCEWLLVDQEAVDDFARASGDDQWIHVDTQKANAGPFGTTICHGLLTLAIGQSLARRIYRVSGTRMGINYGLNKVRFPSPLPVGSQVRATVELLGVEAAEDSWHVRTRVVTMREGSEKPVCVADPLTRLYVEQ